MNAAIIASDAELGMTWWNGLTEIARAEWMARANSAIPADAWRAFQSGTENAKAAAERMAGAAPPQLAGRHITD